MESIIFIKIKIRKLKYRKAELDSKYFQSFTVDNQNFISKMTVLVK